jgi:AraC family transcriptional regulator
VLPLKIHSLHGVREFTYQSRAWNDFAVDHATWHHDSGRIWQNLTAHRAAVVVVLEQTGGVCEPRLRIDRPTVRDRYDAGHTTFIPPNVDVWGYADSINIVRDIRIHFDYSSVESYLGEDFDPKRWSEPLLLFYDHRITRCAELLATECAEQGGSSIYGESVTTALLAALFASPRTRLAVAQSGLARRQLRKTLDYIDENLLKDIRVKELADVVGLSSSQFGRAFKASTGVTPYRWVIEQRISRAKRLMTMGGKSLSLVANLVGFANQSHFTKAFRHVTGTTPGHWFQQIGGRKPV